MVDRRFATCSRQCSTDCYSPWRRLGGLHQPAGSAPAASSREFRRGYQSHRFPAGQRHVAQPLAMSVLYDIANCCRPAGRHDQPAHQASWHRRYALLCRYGPCVEGAGIHHNPTPGPANHAFLYGHSFVTLAWMVEHPQWGTRALPIRAELYVRQKPTLPKIPKERRPKFRTKLTPGRRIDRVGRRVPGISRANRSGWSSMVVMPKTGSHPSRSRRTSGITLIGRLRKGRGRLRSLPGPQPGQQAWPQASKYGKEVIRLAQACFGHRQGWQNRRDGLVWEEGGRKPTRHFLATWKPGAGSDSGGVGERGRWVGGVFLHRSQNATPAEILEMVSPIVTVWNRRSRMKEASVGAPGQQQLREF